MNNVTREEVLSLARRAHICGQPNLGGNLYVVAELMSDSGDKSTRTIAEVFEAEINGSIGRLDREMDAMADDGAARGMRLGIGHAAGMVS